MTTTDVILIVFMGGLIGYYIGHVMGHNAGWKDAWALAQDLHNRLCKTQW